MIVSSQMLINQLKLYSDPYGKIRRMCQAGKLYPLTKGLYETSGNRSGYLLAPVLYGPSYLSFQYALSRHGLIPEAVHEYTSATCQKGRKKHFSNHFGDYFYRDVPAQAFPYETYFVEEDGYIYSLASPEKALCDTIYALPRIKNQKEIQQVLFENLRIDPDEFSRLDKKIIADLSEKYYSQNVRLLEKYMRRES